VRGQRERPVPDCSKDETARSLQTAEVTPLAGFLAFWKLRNVSTRVPSLPKNHSFALPAHPDTEARGA
jgi:hypothetical protein